MITRRTLLHGPAALVVVAVVLTAGACSSGGDGTPTSPPSTPTATGPAGATQPGGDGASSGTAAPAPTGPGSTVPVAATSPAGPGPTAGAGSGSTGADPPRIVRFVVAPDRGVACDDAGVGATMSWEVVPEDVAVRIELDGVDPGVARAGYGGRAVGERLPDSFRCDGRTHTLTLVVTGPGGTARASAEVTTIESSSTHPARPGP